MGCYLEYDSTAPGPNPIEGDLFDSRTEAIMPAKKPIQPDEKVPLKLTIRPG
jgi:hypothetical protein